MFVYLIFNEDTGQYKIGVSKNPERRLREEQTASPGRLAIHSRWQSKYPYKVETLLHAYFREDHAAGEWFNLGIDAVERFQARCAHYEPYVRLRYAEPEEFDW
jgi:hypothetical protein